MESIADRTLEKLKGYDQSEVYISRSVINTVYIDNSKISNIESKVDTGMMVRMQHEGRMGKASVTLVDDSSPDRCLDMAGSVLKFSPETESSDYPYKESARISMPDVFDRRVESISPEDLRELAKGVIDSCDVNIPRAQIRVSVSEKGTLNSNGVDAWHSSTNVYGHFTSMYRGEHPGEGTEFYHGTHLDIDPQKIGASLSSKAKDAASSVEYKGNRNLTMILPPSELGDMLTSSVGSAVNGENVKHGNSLWKDSVGEMVASKELCITDDPTVSAPLSCVFDDEGAPAYRKPLIENGVLRTFLRDSYCGESTGNGMRRSSVEPQEDYERTPVIKPLNLVVKTGRYSREDIISQTDDGILVEKFAWPEADGLTGRFGLSIRCGYLIHKGEIVSTISNALLAGNMLEAVKNVRMIGNDPTQMGVITVPTMSFDGMELIGN